jgi:hypothetical protein
LVDVERLRKIADVVTQDPNWIRFFEEAGFRFNFSFETQGEPILVTDPIYLADVWNSKDALSDFVRKYGAMGVDFGGDTSCPIWWEPPYVTLPVSGHYYDKSFDRPFPHGEAVPPSTATVISDYDVGCDSGSFVFLPLVKDVPPALNQIIDETVTQRNGAILSLPAGRWTLYFEQFDVPEGSYATWYRNIILKWEPLKD